MVRKTKGEAAITREQLLDAATPQGQRLVTIVDALRQRPQPGSAGLRPAS